MKRIASVLLVCAVSTMLAAMCLPAFAAEAAPAAAPAAAPPSTEIHGYMQNRIYASEGSNARYRLERVSLSAQRAIGEGTAYAEFYYHQWIPSSTAAEQFRFYLESAYYDFPLGTGRLRAGKGRQITFGMVPSYGNRKTSNYGIVAETFTQDRIAGLQYYYAQPTWDLGIGVYESPRIRTRATGGLSGVDPSIPARTDNTVFHLAERDIPAEFGNTDRMSVSARLGGKWSERNVFAGISGSYGKLLPEDIAFVNANTGLALTGRDHSRWGVDATWKIANPWVLQGEYYGASIDDLDYSAWDILAGYEPVGKMRFYARYSQYNIDTPAIPITVAAPFGDVTWDQQQWSLSAVYPIKKNIWLQLEAEFNDEDPPAGVAKVDNDVFFLELFTGF